MTALIKKEADFSSKKSSSGIGLAWQIAIGLVIGIGTGLLLNAHPAMRAIIVVDYLQPAGDLFIKLIKMIVVPIVFTSMIVGIAGTGDGKSLGRIGLKTIVYFEIITTLAIVFGLIFGLAFQPGSNTDISQLAHVNMSHVHALENTATAPHGIMALILGIVPDNIISAMGRGDLLPIIFFSILFGIGLQYQPDEIRKPVVSILRGTSEVMFKVTSIVMKYAPVGVAALIAVTVANFGFSSLIPLLKLLGITYAAIISFTLIVLGITARLFGFNIFHLLLIIKDELLIAFTTCSSATVLPTIIKKMEDYGSPKAVTAFVIPTGYVFNLDGASIYLGIGTLFIAQLYGIHLGVQELVMLVLTMVVTSKGAAGVPGFMFVILLATLSSAGLPLEGLALIAGVDRIMDMGRTALNVVGNSLATLIVAKWEGVYDAEKGKAYFETITRSKT
ncbi:cation:dicarboxylate symporter family transporter [Zymobacter palmae]|uniref:Na+/H+-dicarboxylate symporters n=1 Tax=Zymobacter palmae TaxID=33074 RepID=A0A348HC29_9GAMM|nr:cation:dicarboxylase symporter family transporter [Zymobacter palmae]BBG29181.1 Na+/H+-dicarboxylate symporters [Zymobacter palmae]